MIPSLFEMLGGAVQTLSAVRRWVAFWGPVGDAPALIGPFLAIGSVLTLAILTGIAITSLATFLVTLLVLYLVLTEVFDISIELNA
jgi:hypothetical protein